MSISESMNNKKTNRRNIDFILFMLFSFQLLFRWIIENSARWMINTFLIDFPKRGEYKCYFHTIHPQETSIPFKICKHIFISSWLDMTFWLCSGCHLRLCYEIEIIDPLTTNSHKETEGNVSKRYETTTEKKTTKNK